jgi:hypothetical protein
MRRLEIAGTSGLLLYTLHLVFAPSDHEATFAFILGIAAFLNVCHLWLDGYRWQMAPAYFVAFGLVAYECIHRLMIFNYPILEDRLLFC